MSTRLTIHVPETSASPSATVATVRQRPLTGWSAVAGIFISSAHLRTSRTASMLCQRRPGSFSRHFRMAASTVRGRLESHDVVKAPAPA